MRDVSYTSIKFIKIYIYPNYYFFYFFLKKTKIYPRPWLARELIVFILFLFFNKIILASSIKINVQKTLMHGLVKLKGAKT
jgi:hypothetical protein